MPPPERRAVRPAHPLPAGLATPDDWQLRVAGLGAQPLALSLREVDALGAQAQAADFVCEEGW
jgi:DMSO/TMAO reductase YedYZ molybdopterin-dependent catalytic subunit